MQKPKNSNYIMNNKDILDEERHDDLKSTKNTCIKEKYCNNNFNKNIAKNDKNTQSTNNEFSIDCLNSKEPNSDMRLHEKSIYKMKNNSFYHNTAKGRENINFPIENKNSLFSTKSVKSRKLVVINLLSDSIPSETSLTKNYEYFLNKKV
ncbi:hypothetical protein EDEG_00389 [Edhazardia aedis USNM 41457]|uniref:Uncharacterized protein n=1 Tax=Edhazardia aedis (strain USNM 41457) TaxID=1003232 RepID=J8ZPV3_EDHAE|nr:hypothetical protein EDEG_00389 [Edhazardia aedis USNM 41457]|eukprot:EJW01723.1 hypothetical protein EDEG_00389 [Edhazardia aedis USNM 41457]